MSPVPPRCTRLPRPGCPPCKGRHGVFTKEQRNELHTVSHPGASTTRSTEEGSRSHHTTLCNLPMHVPDRWPQTIKLSTWEPRRCRQQSCLPATACGPRRRPAWPPRRRESALHSLQQRQRAELERGMVSKGVADMSRALQGLPPRVNS